MAAMLTTRADAHPLVEEGKEKQHADGFGGELVRPRRPERGRFGSRLETASQSCSWRGKAVAAMLANVRVSQNRLGAIGTRLHLPCGHLAAEPSPVAREK